MSLYLRKYCFICFILWGTIYSLVAQNNQFLAYTVEDGLPQSQVYDIIQDNIGYLWLGTQGGGISRFNGKDFKTWNKGHGLLSNYIHALNFTNDTLFIGSKEGLTIKTKKSFVSYKSPQINKIYRDNNNIYLATSLGIYQYFKNSGVTKLRLHPKLDTNRINDIYYDGNLYWIATYNGLWKLKSMNSNSSRIDKHSIYNFTSIVGYKNKIFAASFNKGVLIIDPMSQKKPNRWVSKPLRINNIAVHNKDEIWIATDTDGIVILNADNYRVKRWINQKNSFTVSHIRKSISDRQSNIWVATSGGGVYKYFQNNFIHYNKDSGLKGNQIYAVHAVKNNIWASNSETGLIKIDSTGIEHVPTDKYFNNIKFKTIASDTDGNVWLGSESKGILLKQFTIIDSLVIDTEKKKRTILDTIRKIVYKNHIINTKKGLPSNWIRHIVVDTTHNNNTIWVATYSSGIIKFSYDTKKKRLKNVKRYTKKDGIKDLKIMVLKIDDIGRVWYTTQNGDIGYIDKNKVSHFGNVINEQSSINNIIFYKNSIFIGSAGNGVWKSNLTNDIKFEKLKGLKSLYSDNIYQMIVDHQHNLWVGSEQGVDKVLLNKNNDIVDVFHYGRNDGFLGIETCLNAITKDKKDNLWFGTIYGLSKYDPLETTKKTIKPKLFFEDIEVSYQSIDSININEYSKNNNILKLKSKQTELSFSYKTIDLDHPNEVQYRFKLNHSAWSPWSLDKKQNFAGLTFGNYSFSAQSRNYRWEESDPITFNFMIDSPLHKKSWYQAVVFTTAILFLALLALLYLRRVRLKNKEERELLQMQNHLLSLEQKALRLQMNPHFIFNVLNGIKAMGTNDPVKMNTTINTFATLLREILHNSRKNDITLDQEIKTLKHYIEVEQLMTNKTFTSDISITSDIDPEEILIPPMLIQPFVENSIRHGILKGNKHGVLNILFHTDEDFLYCTIKDNGQGIFQSQKTKPKTDHQSMALTVTTERLESISGKDSLEIKEIYNTDNTVAGTQITFKIPLQTDF